MEGVSRAIQSYVLVGIFRRGGIGLRNVAPKTLEKNYKVRIFFQLHHRFLVEATNHDGLLHHVGLGNWGAAAITYYLRAKGTPIWHIGLEIEKLLFTSRK
jgi:hypothetical protein